VAIASLVLGIVGLLITLGFGAGGIFFGGPLALCAILFGVAARRRRAANDGPRGLGTAGIAVGAAALAVGALLFGLAAVAWSRHA
jgi:tetrahydromethanopterin S-methyltransferase subunit C